MTALWLLALAGLLGSVLLFLAGLGFMAFYSRRPFPAIATSTERKFVFGAFAAAILGSVGLFIFPAYQGSSCSTSVSVTVSPASPSQLSTANIPMSACTERSPTFIQANGPQVIPLFTVPVLFAAIPFVFLRRRFRSLAFSVCAFLLAGQAAVGMSGYGLAFSPSSILLVVAGFIGLCSQRAQQGAAPEKPAFASLRQVFR